MRKCRAQFTQASTTLIKASAQSPPSLKEAAMQLSNSHLAPPLQTTIQMKTMTHRAVVFTISAALSFRLPNNLSFLKRCQCQEQPTLTSKTR